MHSGKGSNICLRRSANSRPGAVDVLHVEPANRACPLSPLFRFKKRALAKIQSGLRLVCLVCARRRGVLNEAVLAMEAEVTARPDHAEAWRLLGTVQAENDDDQQVR